MNVSQGNSAKYLKYAVGETVLVVIGILIALYINNWNEERKNQRANLLLLDQLKGENQLNISDLTEDLAYRDTIVMTLYKFHQFLKKENIESQPEVLSGYLKAMLRATSYAPSNNYLKKYIGSNNGNNSQLTTELIQLDFDQAALKTISDKSFEFKLQKYYEFLASDVDFENMEILSYDKLKSLEFRNNIMLIGSAEEGVYDKFMAAFNQQKLIDSLITEALR